MLGELPRHRTSHIYKCFLHARARALDMTAVCGVCAINIIIMENVQDTAERIIKKFFL